MVNYKPRRQSKRWLDGDCPKGVLAIYDDSRTFDRYTVFFTEPAYGTTYADMVLSYIGMSENPFHPQGFGQNGELTAHDTARFRYENSKRAAKWSSLPEAVKKCVLMGLNGY